MNTLLTTAAAVAIAVIGFGMQAAAASTYTVEHNFCVKSNCTDGGQPTATPIADASGNYYGTTVTGGSTNNGTVYRMSFDGTAWKTAVLHSFCLKTDCSDGAQPHGGLIMDSAGNLYGMTSSGGYNDAGAVYELSPNGSKWTYTLLYKFCKKSGCPDGQNPYFASLSYQGAATGAAYDGTSPLYGTTQMGGANQDGVVFQLTPSGGTWTESTVHDFCALANCIDGGLPFAGVVVDGSGNIFGTAPLGGVGESEDCCGVLFELKHGAHWTYTQLYNFCSDMVSMVCLDGQGPLAPPMIDAMGNLYGTTALGGSHNLGTVYKVVPNGSNSKITTLYNFCPAKNCPDGDFPWTGALTMDSAGTLYGTTSQGGGKANAGTVFSLSGPKLNKFNALVVFTGRNGGAAQSGVTLDASGALYGVTQGGGKELNGVFYKIVP
jgi:uncharacterized repeat protein (TIGR03803 family)